MKSNPSDRPEVDPGRLESYIKDLGLSYKANSKSFIFTCPLCNKKDRLYIRKKDGRFACFKCRTDKGFQGAPEYAIAELTGRPVRDIKDDLYGTGTVKATTHINLQLDDFFDNEDEEEIIDELPTCGWPYDCVPLDHPWSAKGLQYLEQARGIPLAIATQYGIRYSTQKTAVCFPVYVGQYLVGWQYRTVLPTVYELPDGTKKERLRIWSNTDIPRDRVVMFQNRLQGSEHVIICEGPVDAIKCHLLGGNIATMGKAISHPQIEMLARSGVKKIYLGLDPDAASEISRILTKFSDLPCYIMKLPKRYKDLGAMPFEEVVPVFREAELALSTKLYIFLKPLAQPTK